MSRSIEQRAESSKVARHIRPANHIGVHMAKSSTREQARDGDDEDVLMQIT